MIGDLDFRNSAQGARKFTLTLMPCLYLDGASCDLRYFDEISKSGKLGNPVKDRLTLVYAIHEELDGRVSSGGSWVTLKTNINSVRNFYSYCDKVIVHPTMDNACRLYCDWLVFSYEAVARGSIGEAACYSVATQLATILGNATGLGREYFVIHSGLRAPKAKKVVKVDKQNLEAAKSYIADLLDVCHSLDIDAFNRSLPVNIEFTDKVKFTHYSGLTQHQQRLPHCLLDISLERRYPLYNLRVEAEMLIFISQTSMNLSSAANLEFQKLTYHDVGEKFEARAYKGRRGGEVLFSAYSGYKSQFLKFLEFRESLGIHERTAKLFGRLPQPGVYVSDSVNPRAIYALMKSLKRPTVCASELRTTRQNWLSRRIGDASLAAEIGQHDLATFERSYRRSNHQTAASEWTTYFKRSSGSQRAAMDGICNGEPLPVEMIPSESAKPDCLNQNLCLFCVNYKGVKSYSYIWSLVSYRTLREQEKLLSLQRNGDVSEVDIALLRLEQIITAFGNAGKKCSVWLEKALEQTQGGSYHPRWRGFIHMLGLSQVWPS